MKGFSVTVEAKKWLGILRRRIAFMSDLFQNLDYSYLDYRADQAGYAMERIRVLEAEVAALKARRPT